MDNTAQDPFVILLVEDDAATRQFMKLLLRNQGHEVIEAENGLVGYEIARTKKVDLVLSDVMMPKMNGIEMCRRIKQTPKLELLPVILVTALDQESDRIEGLNAGADEFLTKPVNELALQIRLRNFRRVIALQNEVKDACGNAERLVRERTVELEKTIDELHITQAEAAIAQLEVIHRLAAASEYKDSDTGSHIQRISEYSLILAKCLGWFSPDDTVQISQAATMHDVGKIGIADYILMKPGLLTSDEFEEMKKHTILGWRLLSGSSTPLLQRAAVIARSHHERWDGSGYPDGLVGEDIPPEARIVSVADVFDALRAQRCYKPEYPIQQCLEMIKSRSGQHFDPEVVEAFTLCAKEIIGVDHGLDDLEVA